MELPSSCVLLLDPSERNTAIRGCDRDLPSRINLFEPLESGKLIRMPPLGRFELLDSGHFPDRRVERHAALDDAETGDGVERRVVEGRASEVHLLVADRAAADGLDVGQVDAVKTAVAVEPQPRQ